VISNLGTLEYNWGFLPTLLDGSRSKNNISKPLGYSSNAFGAPEGLGAFGAFGGPILNPILLDEQFVKFSN
jgi:hypothetical protein